MLHAFMKLNKLNKLYNSYQIMLLAFYNASEL